MIMSERTYIPDKWVVVEIKTNDDEVNRKVMASWYGGYLGSDSWKLSSGITETVEYEDHYEFINHSGSVYKCGKNSFGLSGYAYSVLESFKKDIERQGSIEIIDIRSE
jgi:alpha-tubulin suppressor-like RCC1 family protein